MTIESANPTKCPKCGAPLTAESAEGLCPRCLVAMNFATQTVFTDPEAGKSPERSVPAPEEIAKNFPQLEILECLGRGGMGVVYKARQPKLDRFVALKVLAPEWAKDPQFASRFQQEAQALARLSHPNIVTVHDFGQAGGLYFLIMEFVDGLNLRQLLRARKITPEEALAIVPPICEALQYAHDRGVVHRDIKPENLLMDKQGRLKIADFGIARILGINGTVGGAEDKVMGTPRYMAPEQKENPRLTDHRADIYSLGVVLYEMLTGEVPSGAWQAPSKKVQVDVRLDEIVLRALEHAPELRFQQASQVKTAVETLAMPAFPLATPEAAEVAALKQELNALKSDGRRVGNEYKSKATIFGIPLVHIASGYDPVTGRNRQARGIIAIGDSAIGVLAMGGWAIGGIAFGGMAVGLVSFGGMSLGLLLAVGGLAVGSVAVGGTGWGFYRLMGSHADYQLIRIWQQPWSHWLLGGLIAFSFIPLAVQAAVGWKRRLGDQPRPRRWKGMAAMVAIVIAANLMVFGIVVKQQRRAARVEPVEQIDLEQNPGPTMDPAEVAGGAPAVAATPETIRATAIKLARFNQELADVKGEFAAGKPEVSAARIQGLVNLFAIVGPELEGQGFESISRQMASELWKLNTALQASKAASASKHLEKLNQYAQRASKLLDEKAAAK